MARIWTIGHSTRGLEEFIAILRAHAIEKVADVRQLPGSGKFPHFNREILAPALAGAGIGYVHLPELGGRRKVLKDSQNTAWRLKSFRGYADYMETQAFAAGLERLVQLAGMERVAVMCAEAVWWRCHRSMIADALKAKGHEVIHLFDAAHTQIHPWTSAARIVNGKLSYRKEPAPDLLA